MPSLSTEGQLGGNRTMNVFRGGGRPEGGFSPTLSCHCKPGRSGGSFCAKRGRSTSSSSMNFNFMIDYRISNLCEEG